MTRAEGAFLQEIALMSYFQSDAHFAQIVGFSLDPCSILMKHYPLGSLKEWISTRRSTSSTLVCAQLIEDVSHGVFTMHDNGFIHCDMKPGNILVSQEADRLHAVLADFGIVRVLNPRTLLVEAFQKSKMRGWSPPYCAPEVLSYLFPSLESTASRAPLNFENSLPSKVMEPLDIYSMGIVMYELILAKKPWPRTFDESMAREVIAGYRPLVTAETRQKLDEAGKFLLGLAELCWQQEPVRRPQARYLVREINNFLRNLKM